MQSSPPSRNSSIACSTMTRTWVANSGFPWSPSHGFMMPWIHDGREAHQNQHQTEPLAARLIHLQSVLRWPHTDPLSASRLPQMEIQENIALAPLTTLRVGGKARYFVRADTIDDVQTAVAFADSKKLPLFVLGGGSNVLVSDNGWPGLVLQIGISGIEHNHRRETVGFIVGAGENWDDF